MQVHNPINPTGILLYENFFFNYVFPKKSFVENNKIQKRLFYPNFKPFQCFNKTLHKKITLSEKDSYDLHCSYATLVTYVTVLGAEYFQFPCRVIFHNTAQTGLNWFLLILQTAKPSTKKGKYGVVPKIFYVIFLFNQCDNALKKIAEHIMTRFFRC